MWLGFRFIYAFAARYIKYGNGIVSAHNKNLNILIGT